jgi:acyl carrier protein
MPTLDELREQIDERKELCSKVKQLVVDRLDVPVDPDWITDDQPLFGRGLELDSVDALELVVGLEYEFAVSVTDDQMDVFGSIARLAEHIEEEL